MPPSDDPPCFYFSFYIMISGNFFGLEIRHGIFFGVKFCWRDFWGVLLEALGMPSFDDPPCLFISGVPP